MPSMRANGLSIMPEELAVGPDPQGMANLLAQSADAAPGHFGSLSPLSRKVMALTAASRPLTAVTPATTSPIWQAPSKSPPPTSANMSNTPSILAGSAMLPNSSRWALYLARTSAALAADLQRATKAVNSASPSRYWAVNALARKSRPRASTMRYWTVSSIRFFAGSMARPHRSAASPFSRFASVSAK